jgi:CO/xanthine dehydrogenase FAD-binding subunit
MHFITPKTIAEALAAKKEFGYPVLAGGTDLLVQWKGVGLPHGGAISLSGIPELKDIVEEEDRIIIGATATHADIYDSVVVRQYLPALVAACRTVGALQIQNRGTIGGNVMNASPAGDTLPALLAYDADVVLAGAGSTRTVNFGKFYSGYRQTAVSKEEIVTKFIFRKPPQGERAVFMKVGTRQAQAISKVSGCFRMVVNGNNEVESVAIAYGSVAPVPIRCPKTEEFLRNAELNGVTIEGAIKLAREEVAPIDDIRSTGSYRRHVAGVMLKRFLI